MKEEVTMDEGRVKSVADLRSGTDRRRASAGLRAQMMISFASTLVVGIAIGFYLAARTLHIWMPTVAELSK